MSVFRIKRGMVFFLNEPSRNVTVQTYGCTKNRPYVVISNNKCNDTSLYIHVAPMTTQEDEKGRYYKIPVELSDGRISYINISNLCLVEKRLCNMSTYDHSLTESVMNNPDVLEKVRLALIRHFDLEVVPTPEEDFPPVVKQVAETVKFNLPISITVSIPVYNAVTVDMASTESVEASRVTESVECEDSATPITPPKEKKDSNQKTARQHFTESDKDSMMNYIKNNYTVFGGKKSAEEICKDLHICSSTLYRLVSKIKSPGSGYNEPTRTEVIKQFLTEHPEMSASDVSERFHVSMPTAYKYIRKYGKSNSHRGRLITLSEQVLKQYKGLGGTMTVAELADFAGVSWNTIYRRLREYKDSHKQEPTPPKKYSKYMSMNAVVRKHFIEDYEKLPEEEVFEMYKCYGIQSIEHMRKLYKAKKKLVACTK